MAVKLSKICNDMRLLSSGPHTGFNEINLPKRQPGSTIMPGKVNPVIPEVVNQIAFQVIGNDLTVTFCAEAGQLQLNAFLPTISFNLFESFEILANGADTLRRNCIIGITANKERCLSYVNESMGVATALAPVVGYEVAASIIKEAESTKKSIACILEERDLMTREQYQFLLNPLQMLKPNPRRPID
jgi:aspartate ammonia-lyase